MVRVVRPQRDLLDAVARWTTFRDAVDVIRGTLAADGVARDWGARLFVSGDPPQVVGWGGFKGPPRDGVVEVGYEVAPPARGRGLATAAVRSMVAEAFADERVTTVIAHTSAERNASNRVLEKAGFNCCGEVEQQGERVWRYALARAGSDR